MYSSRYPPSPPSLKLLFSFHPILSLYLASERPLHQVHRRRVEGRGRGAGQTRYRLSPCDVNRAAVGLVSVAAQGHVVAVGRGGLQVGAAADLAVHLLDALSEPSETSIMVIILTVSSISCEAIVAMLRHAGNAAGDSYGKQQLAYQ